VATRYPRSPSQILSSRSQILSSRSQILSSRSQILSSRSRKARSHLPLPFQPRRRTDQRLPTLFVVTGSMVEVDGRVRWSGSGSIVQPPLQTHYPDRIAPHTSSQPSPV